MIILAVDTATRTCSVALLDGDSLLAESLLYGQKHHSEKILGLIEGLFLNTGITGSQLDLIAVATGPGSFTGLRVGLSTAQGLALSLDKPLLGVSTLEVIAAQLLPSERICPMIDARKGQVYTCLYECEAQGRLKKTVDDTVMRAEAWVAGLEGAIVFAGNGACLYREKIQNAFHGTALFAPAAAGIPRASTLGCIARERAHQAQHHEPERITPHYVRPPDAMAHKHSEHSNQ